MYSHKNFITGTVPDCQITKIRNGKSQRVSNRNANVVNIRIFYIQHKFLSVFAINKAKIMPIHLSLSSLTGKGTTFTHICNTEMANKIRKCE